MNLKISYKISLLSISLVITTAAIVSYIYFNKVNEVLAKNSLKILTHEIDNKSQQLTNKIEKLESDTLFLASIIKHNLEHDKLIDNNSTFTNHWQEHIVKLLDEMLIINPDYLQIAFIATNGDEVVRRDQGRQTNPTLLNRAHTDYFRESIKLSDGDLFLSEINLNRENKKITIPHTPVIRCSTPLFHNNNMLGFVIIKFNFGTQLEALNTAYQDYKANIYIANDSGSYLLHPQKHKQFGADLGHRYRVQEEFPLVSPLFIDAGKTSITLIPKKNSINNAATVFIKTRLDNRSDNRFITIGLSKNYDEIIKDQYPVLTQTYLYVILLTIIGIAVALGFSRYFSRPLHSIILAINNFKNGQTNIELPTSRNDEIGLLAKDFEDMVKQVNCSHEELSKLNATLEDKVAERTEESERYAYALAELQNITTSFATSFDDQCQQLLELGLNIFQLDVAIISHIEGEVYTVEYIRSPDGNPPAGSTFEFKDTYCSHTFAANKPLGFHHVADSEINMHPCYKAFGLEAYLGAPIFINEQRYGTINFSSPDPRSKPFTETDYSLIKLFSQWLSSSLARNQIQKSLSQFKTTLDMTLDCVFMFNADDLKFFYVNEGAMQQVGYSREELIDMHPYDIKPEFDEQAFREFVASIMTGNQSVVNLETIHQHKDGHTIPVEIFLQYIHPANELPRFVAIVRDITERKKVDKMKNEFISTVSHELRTPLTSIRGSLGLLVGGDSELPEQTRMLLSIANKNTERLLLLINDILDISKIESGKMAFTFKSLNIRKLLDDAISANHAYGEKFNVTFQFIKPEKDIYIYADETRLMQVMNNLLSNAAKFSPAGDRVIISTEIHDSVIRVLLKDNGPGIPESFRKTIFDKFSQLDSSDTRSKGGTGLGLNITRAIVEKHGGKLDFISLPGKGTTFFFDLPIEHISELDSARGSKENKRNILICEDEADIAHLLSQICEKESLSCDIARNGQQARELLEANSYDAMTLDILLPDLNGVELLADIRSNPKTRNLPVIVVSAVADETRKNLNGGAVGIADWMTKPFDQQRLLNSIGNIIKHHPENRPRILHVEDEEDVIAYVRMLFDDKVSITSVRNLTDARQALQASNFDLILLDIGLPDGSGMELVSEINAMEKHIPIVIFSAQELDADTAKQFNAVLIKSRVDNKKLFHTIMSHLSSADILKE